MAIKKSQLYSSIWKSCDELRGGTDASQYKDYVLVFLFIKYVSDKYAGVPYAPITVPEGSSFKDMVALKGNPNIGEDGYFADFEKVNKASVTSRIKEIKNKPEDAEELKVMEKYLALGGQESEAKKKIKEAEKALDARVIDKYKTLTESEIKVLVVDDKWVATLEQAVKGEMDRISQRLTQRIKELAERYATPLPMLITETETLTKKVDAHIEKMGFILN